MPPPFSEAPEVVECLLYHGDVEDVHGPTCIVPREPGGDDEAYDSCELKSDSMSWSSITIMRQCAVDLSN